MAEPQVAPTTAGTGAADRAFWRRCLTPPAEAAVLPGGPARGRGRRTLSLPVPEALVAAVAEVSRGSASLAYAVYLTGLVVCVAGVGGRRRLRLGVARRRSPRDRDPAELLPVAFEVDGDRDLRHHLVAVRDTLDRAESAAGYPWRTLLAGRGSEGPGDELFEVAVIPELDRPAPVSAPPLVVVVPAAGSQLVVHYAADRLQPTAVRRLARRLLHVLASGLAAPTVPLGRLDLLGAVERQIQLLEWAGAPVRPPAAEPVHLRVAAGARSHPDAVAVDAGPLQLSYGELTACALGLARRLRERGVAGDVPVAIYADRSPEVIEALLAVLLAGGACVPFDPAYPARRLRDMAETVGARIVLAAPRYAAEPSPVEAEVIVLGRPPVRPAAAAAAPPPAPADPEQLAYVLFTSGSTGRPKGVAMPHRALALLVDWQCRRPPSDPGLRTLQFAPLGFDVAFQEIFSTLVAGGRLVLPAAGERRTGERFYALLERQRIERLFLPFNALRLLADVAPAGGGRLPLRSVITAGEPLQVDRAIAGLFERAPAAVLDNQYGPTESHVVSAHTLAGPAGRWPLLPPIGRPLPAVRLLLLDSRLHPAGLGREGELCIGGPCLARGYLGRPAVTAERFVPDPWSQTPGGRLYRTGDLACHLPDGVLEFRGRSDAQVKVRGIRVEPGEIEAVLCDHPSVRQAAVVAADAGVAGHRLVAYVVPAAAEPPDAARLRDFLSDRLPEPMLPSAFFSVGELPTTPSGKVDRRALPPAGAVALTAPSEPPQGPVEEAATEIWRQVLGRADFGVRDNFFALGGHSLLAVQVLSRLADRFGVEVPLSRFFRGPSIAELAAVVAELRTAAADENAVESLLAELEELSEAETRELLGSETAASAAEGSAPREGKRRKEGRP